ncbi:MAG: alpha/beta hydrolase [Gammaproteobacteria bacterium]|nr:alpha/beta hydrolase [Gammaproteobacteria bacterium]
MSIVTILVASCATVPKSKLRTGTNGSECVILLHGLNRSLRAMDEMAEALHDAGYTTANIDYPSQSAPIEEIAPLAVDTGLSECRTAGATTIHFVTHSLGGILLRYRQSQEPIPDLGRVVMLGPPNQGSEVVDELRDWKGADLLGGPAGRQLGTDEESVPSQLGPVDFELGVVAGVGTINPWMSAILPGMDDGKVTVESTRVHGMVDFLIVDSSHAYLMKNEVVIQNTIAFLQTGKFPRLR